MSDTPTLPTPEPRPSFPLSPDDARIAARCDEYDAFLRRALDTPAD